jgi:hypothetical protein
MPDSHSPSSKGDERAHRVRAAWHRQWANLGDHAIAAADAVATPSWREDRELMAWLTLV